MAIFQINKKQGKKFMMSLMIFGFCMERIICMVLRIASVCKNTNVSLAIASQIFVAAGVLLLYIVNIEFAIRITRARHERWGWAKPFRAFIAANYVVILFTIVMVIVATSQSFFTLSNNTRRIDRDIQLYGATYFAVISFLPIPILALGMIIPQSKNTIKFGTGRFRSKVIICLIGTVLICLGASYRAGTSWETPVSRVRSLPNYLHPAAFYIFNFTIEIIVVFLYALVRVDLRFMVPLHSKKTRSYRDPQPGEPPMPPNGIFTEEETFDGDESERTKSAIHDEEKASEKKDINALNAPMTAEEEREREPQFPEPTKSGFCRHCGGEL